MCFAMVTRTWSALTRCRARQSDGPVLVSAIGRSLAYSTGVTGGR